MKSEKCQITLDPAILTTEERMRVANAVTGECDVLLMSIMAGRVVGVDTESRGGGAKPLPSITSQEAEWIRGHSRKKGGNVPLRNGIIAFHLNLHDIDGDGRWRRRGWTVCKAFFNESEKNAGDVDWAVHFAACKTKRRNDTFTASIIGGVCLSAVRDWGGTMVEAETYIEGILENDPRRRKPAMNEVRMYIDAHHVIRRGRQDYDLIAVLKDGFKKLINR